MNRVRRAAITCVPIMWLMAGNLALANTADNPSAKASGLIAGNESVGFPAYPRGDFEGIASLILEEGENALASAVIDEANGYAYFGTGSGTFPARVIKVALGDGTSPPTRVGTATMAQGEAFLDAAVIDAENGYAYFGTLTQPGRVIKVALGAGDAPPMRLGALTLEQGENALRSAVIDTENGYAYFGTGTVTGRIVKVALGEGDALPTRIGAATLASGEQNVLSGVIDPVRGYAYFGAGTTPGRVVKVALGEGDTPPVRVGAVTMNPGEGSLGTAGIDTSNGYAYFTASGPVSTFIKVALGEGDAAPTRAGAALLDPNDSLITSLAIAPEQGVAYLGSVSSVGRVIQVALGADDAAPVRLGAAILGADAGDLTTAVLDTARGFGYFGAGSSPGRVQKVILPQAGGIHGTLIDLPEEGSIEEVRLYSHRAVGTLRLAIYRDAADLDLLWESGPTPNTAEEDWIMVAIEDGAPPALDLSAGTYWLAWQLDAAVPVPSLLSDRPAERFFLEGGFGPFPPVLAEGTAPEPAFFDGAWSAYLVYDNGAPAFNPADINRDGFVNAIDVQLAINGALGIPLEQGLNADINGDGAVNAIDVQLVINAALGIPILEG